MQNPNRRRNPGSALSSAIVLAFGLLSLAFLVAIDQEHWFHIKPASGTANAMALASDRS